MSKTDFSAMSKEEIIEYYEKKMSEQAMHQSKTILNLKSELTKSKQALSESQIKLETEKSDNTKLKNHNNNLTDLISNILSNVKEHQNTYYKLLSEENIPSVDTASATELNMYFEGLMITLFNAADALIKHQERSLNLGTSERNVGVKPAEDYSADENAKAEGDAALERTALTTIDDEENQDFNEVTESFEQQTTEGGLKNSEIDNIILKGCSNRKKDSISSELSEVTAVIEQAQQQMLNDDTSLNKTRANEKCSGFVSVCNSDRVAGILENDSGTELRMYCTVCGRIETFKLNFKKKRINSILTITDNLNSLGSVLSSVQLATCTKCGANVEINPASLLNVSFKSSVGCNVDDNGTGYEHHVDSEETNKTASDSPFGNTANVYRDTLKTEKDSDVDSKETSLGQNYRKALYNQISKNESVSCQKSLLTDELIKNENGKLPVINPVSFNANVFGMTPAFVKSRLSTSLLAACGTQFSMLGAPKNRTFNYFEGNGFPMSRAHLTGAVNSFARAFLHPVTEYIRKDIVRRSPAVIIDESTLLVRESASRKALEGKSRKSQIWTLNSNWTSEIKASWFTVSDSRSYKNVLDILGNDVKNEDSPLKYLISDGYAGYDAAIKILNEQGVSIESCRCFAHARRPVHFLLKELGLLRIYNEHLLPAGAQFFDFEKNLLKYRETKAGSKLSEKSVQLLSIYWMINSLFVIDSAVVRKHQYVCNTESFKQELMKERTDKSAKIIDAIYDSIRMMIAENPKIMNCSITSKGNIKFIQNRKYPESRALIYLLKFEDALRRFTLSADIELTSSAAERSLKLGICTRHACMFMHSEDGAHAFADFQTITNTCIQNRVPVQHYLVWLVANIKWRMNKLREDGHDDPSFFTMPGKKKLLTGTGEKLIAMYGKENRYGYDKVDVDGLTPYDYRRYIENQL